MKLSKIVILSVLCSIISGSVSAQFSINSKVTPKAIDTRPSKDTIRNQSSVTTAYFNEARYQAERRRIRKERNTVYIKSTLNTSLTQFENWVRGGDNSFSGRGTFFMKHQYQRERFNFTYFLDARYGLNVVDNKKFKNEDYLQFNLSTGWNITKNWSYNASMNFRSQFSKGYKSRTDTTLVSAFMAPGTIDLAVGFKYKYKTLTVSLNPVGGSMTMVLNKQLSEKGSHGVKAGEKQISTLGSSLQVDFNHKFIKDRIEYRTYLYVFSNYSSNTYAIFNNTLDFKIAKVISLSAFCSIVYDQYAKLPNDGIFQYNYTLGLGLAYEWNSPKK